LTALAAPKVSFFEAAIWIVAPVDGLRPSRAADSLTLNFPNLFTDTSAPFASISEAWRLIEAWRVDYNVSRPHMVLGNLTPAEYLAGPETWPAPIGAGQAGN
jgi:transposase InsO family protein